MAVVDLAYSAPRRRNKRFIFICYRRSDCSEISGRLYDWLADAFGERYVVKDVISFPSGIDYREHIAERIPESRMMLVVIGPDWLSRITEAKRGADEDLLRFELELALKHRIPIVPLLTGGARMPKASELPKKLRGLTKRHAVQLRGDPDFRGDVKRLITSLKKL